MHGCDEHMHGQPCQTVLPLYVMATSQTFVQMDQHGVGLYPVLSALKYFAHTCPSFIPGHPRYSVGHKAKLWHPGNALHRDAASTVALVTDSGRHSACTGAGGEGSWWPG
eukprot:m.196349 g.196349  ORF g.196349 m.196349 type:complete len:110 (-) comp19770_c0_seq1:107-436(-)